MKEKVFTEDAPAAIGTYSQAIKIDNVVYFSGQIPLDPNTMTLVSNDFAMQAKQVFTNLEAVAKAANGSLDAIVKLTIYLTDFANFSVFNEIMQTFFSEPFPARTTIGISALPKDALIEIDAIMVME